MHFSRNGCAIILGVAHQAVQVDVGELARTFDYT